MNPASLCRLFSLSLALILSVLVSSMFYQLVLLPLYCLLLPSPIHTATISQSV